VFAPIGGGGNGGASTGGGLALEPGYLGLKRDNLLRLRDDDVGGIRNSPAALARSISGAAPANKAISASLIGGS
jgi:hypothetical protein